MVMRMNKDTIINLMIDDERYRNVVADWILDHADTLAGPEGEPPYRPPVTTDWASFQERCTTWALECFGEDSVHSIVERFDRFIEEVVEFAQSCGIPETDIKAVVDYVYNDKQPGEPSQELGGVMVTLGVLCESIDLSMDRCGENELRRIRYNINQIREKGLTKPRLHNSIPGRSDALNRLFDQITNNSKEYFDKEYKNTVAEIEQSKDAAVRNAADMKRGN